MDAEIKYAEKQNEIKVELSILKEKLKQHKVHRILYMKNPNNWGRVGDLTYILKQLQELNQFLNV
jgi:hypothetical protein